MRMRGRKRQRKKNAKRRGIWKLLVTVTPKRSPRDEKLADALAIVMDYKLRTLKPTPLVGWHPELFGVDDFFVGSEDPLVLPRIPLDMLKKLGLLCCAS